MGWERCIRDRAGFEQFALHLGDAQVAQIVTVREVPGACDDFQVREVFARQRCDLERGTGRIDRTLLNAAMPNVHGAAGFLILALVGASSSLQEGRAGASILLQVPLVVDHHIVMRAGDGCARAPPPLKVGPYAHPPASADALSIMTQAYVKMGMPQLATDSLRVLEVLENPPRPTAKLAAAARRMPKRA